MANLNAILKDADAVLDYKFDWAPNTNQSKGTDWLDTANSEVISSHTVTVQTGLTKDSSSQTDTNTSVTVWLSGGTAGNEYTVECEIVTNQGRTDQRTGVIRVVER